MGNSSTFSLDESGILPVWLSQTLLFGIGSFLAGGLLFDLYLEVALRGDPFWVVFLENGPPLLLAIFVLLETWHLSSQAKKSLYLSEAAKWCALGVGLTMVVSGSAYVAQQVRGTMSPMIVQLIALGSACGVLVGFYTAQLKEAQEELRGLANNIPAALYQFYAREGGDYGTHFVSDHAESLLGISSEPEDFYEQFVEHVPSSHRESLLESIEEAVEEEIPWRFEMPFEKPGGEQMWVLGASIPERREDRIVFNGVILDITERKRMEEELRKLQNFYEQVLEQVPIDLAVFSPDAEFEYLNPQSVSDPDMREWLYGRTNEEYCRERGIDVELGRNRDEAIRRTARTREPVQIEETLQTDQGPLHYLRVHGPVTDLSGKVTHVVAFGLDITDQKNHEQKLFEAKEEAERSARMKSAFLANMSHEIRTPLTSIIGFAEAIGEEVGSEEEGRIPQFAQLIEKSGRRLLETLNGILNFSKLEAGEMELSLKPVDLYKEVKEVTELFERRARESGIRLQIEPCEVNGGGEPPSGPPSSTENSVRAKADKGGLRIVLRNLVSNAIKYTDEGGEVWIRTRSEGGKGVLEVEDTGVGMNPEKVNELFDAFKQESEGKEREYEGTGLGLAVTQRLLAEMDGVIEVETEKGEGSRFIVQLPRADADVSGSQTLEKSSKG